MNLFVLLRALGALSLFLAGVLVVPLALSLWDGDGAWDAFVGTIASSGVLGAGLFFATRSARIELTHREGFGVVTLGWVVYSVLGALPYWLSGAVPAAVDALFETMSGFTTTGASILRDIEALPRSLLLWRALTHWLGGMGIIVLGLAILPLLGIGGMQLFRAEVPGPTTDRLKPRIRDTAKLLWSVYAALTAAEIVLLMIGGLDLFEATCHAFATMATGGFSTRNASAGAYPSAYVHNVITLFMFLAGVNFTLHYWFIVGKAGKALRNEELRFYAVLTGISITLVVAANAASGVYERLAQNVQFSSFQVVSILTTTGFATADYEEWPAVCQVLLVLLMFVGGCAGSTGGGMKVSRVLLILKYASYQVWSLIHPRAVRAVKLGGRRVPDGVLQGVLGYFALYMLVMGLSSLGLAASGVEPFTAVAATIACLSNIGPGLGQVGPAENYAHLPQLAKAILTFDMLVGRLEFYTVLALFFPSAWRR
jgi:trk system potassium uptake protein